MSRMHAIVNAAAARLPRAATAPSPLVRGLAPPRHRQDGAWHLRYAPSALPGRFQIA